MNSSPRYFDLSDDQLRQVHEISEQFEQDLKGGVSVEITDLVDKAPVAIQRFLFSELLEIRLDLLGHDSTLNTEALLAQYPAFHREINLTTEQKTGRNKNEFPVTTGNGDTLADQYNLIEKIGEGGMGEVWKANQTHPVQRVVAIKLIKTGMDSEAVVARFEHERQSLAIMDHPNIARVLDAGISKSGQPFFVMELVDGVRLNIFCDKSKLTLRQRLELFIPICQAVPACSPKRDRAS